MMKKLTCYLLVAGACALAAQTASAQAIISWSGGSQYTSYYGGVVGDVVGYRFTVNSAVYVDSLGIWNGDTSGVGGLDSDHQVGIWDDTMALVTSTTVTSTSTILGDFRYEAITPVQLSVGTTYTIGALYTPTDSDNYISGASSLSTAPEVNWLNAVYPSVGDLGFVYPANDSSSSSKGRFGPNFTFTSDQASATLYCGSGANAATDGFVVTSPPVLGATFDATVTGCNPASVGSVLVGYAAPLTFPSQWGEILVDFTNPQGELLGWPASAGNPAVFSLGVPNWPVLVGMHVYTQAISFGGTFCLHCAYDCVVGY